MGKTSAIGSFHLFIGKTLSTVTLAIGTIILGILIGKTEYGLYTIAVIPAATLLLFQDWGVGRAMSKYCAEYRSTNKEGDLRKIIKSGLIFKIATGIVLTVISLLTANFIASAIYDKPEAAFLITVISITILSTSLLLGAQSIFIGFEKMKLSSYTIFCSAAIQGVLSPLLVYLGYGALGAVLGYTLSSLASCILAITLLYFTIFKKLPPNTSTKLNTSQVFKLLRFGVPLAIATILTGILIQFYSFMMASLIDVTLISNYQIATNFATLIAFVTFPISTVLFPAFSKLDPQNDPQTAKRVFTSSVKYTALFLVPATMALMVLSKPIINTIYGDKWLEAPLFLIFYLTNNLVAVFGNISVHSFLQGIGETRRVLKQDLLTLVIGIPLAFLMIPTFGIIGVILGPYLAGKPSLIWALYWIYKKYKIKVDLKSSAKIFITSVIAALTTYLVLSLLATAEWIKFITGGTIFLGIYLFAAPLTGAVNQTDINNLKTMFSDLGPSSKLVRIPFVLLEKIIKIFKPIIKASETQR
jgi:O-antigen/teichoic acid export membrane protein